MSRGPGDLLSGLSADLRDPLERAAALARKLGIELYLVGGPVRDLLLGERLRDLDLVWEGALEPRRVAEDFGAEFEVPVSFHPEFLTASLAPKSCLRIDLGRARTESYPVPAALPRVRASALAEDLARRDFSVNAMAVSLAEPGTLIDPCAGLGDLERRRLRILHEESFRDDPTRILRGCELAVRRNMVFEPKTKAKIAEAVDARLPALLSGPRVRHELERLFGRPRHAAPGAEVLKALGVDVALRSSFAIDASGLGRLRRLQAWDEAAGSSSDRLQASFWLVALSVLFWSRPLDVRRDLADWLHLSRDGRRWLESAPERLAPLLETPSAVESTLEEMATLYSELSPSEARLADVLGESSDPTRLAVVRELANLDLAISGGDLVRAGISPGPRVGEALEATLTARRRGQIPADGELAFALEWLEREGDGDAS